MFKKAKRANFRRRNESDEDEQDEGRLQQQQLPLPALASLWSTGPAVEEIPFMETSSNNNTIPDSFHSNGFQPGSIRAVKKEKKAKEVAAVPGPTKASLLSFDDEEGES